MRPLPPNKRRRRGVRVVEARRLLLGLPNVTEGRSYGMPSFLLNGRFLARFRDNDTVLVLQLATISERDVVREAWRHVASLPPPRPRKKPARGRKRRERSRGPAAA